MVVGQFTILVAALFWASKTIAQEILQVPGLKVGDSILFVYTGNDLSRVTLSVEDGTGSKGLHLEFRHNEGCKGNPPQLLFTTKTNGKFDSINRKIVNLKELGNFMMWNVTASTDGYLIHQLFNEEVSYKFDYHSPHKLSDVNTIRLYAHPGCGEESSKFNSFLVFVHTVEKFSKITIRARRMDDNGFPAIELRNADMNTGYVEFMVEEKKIWIDTGAAEKAKTELHNPLTPETYVDFTVQHIDGDQYKVIASVDDQVIEQLATISVKHINIVLGFKEIEKLEVIE